MIEIKLKYPVEFEGKTIDTLTIRRPKVKDLKDASNKFKNEEEREMYLFAKLTNQPLELIGELDIADYKQLQEAYLTFLS